MEYTPEEEERIKAIQRHLQGERSVDIYRSQGRSKYWFHKWLNRYKTGHKDWYKSEPTIAKVIPHKTDEKMEQAIVTIRKALMDGMEDFTKYSRVGAEAIQFHMEKLGYQQSEIPSLSTIKRIVKRNKLKVNKPKGAGDLAGRLSMMKALGALETGKKEETSADSSQSSPDPPEGWTEIKEYVWRRTTVVPSVQCW